MGTTRRKRIKIIEGPHSGKTMKADREINFHWKESELPRGQKRRYVYVVEDADIQFISGSKVEEI